MNPSKLRSIEPWSHRILDLSNRGSIEFWIYRTLDPSSLGPIHMDPRLYPRRSLHQSLSECQGSKPGDDNNSPQTGSMYSSRPGFSLRFKHSLHGSRIVITFLKKYFYFVQMGFLLWQMRVSCSEKSQLQQGRATQPTVHAGCSSVSIIHRTLTWTTGSFTCT